MFLSDPTHRCTSHKSVRARVHSRRGGNMQVCIHRGAWVCKLGTALVDWLVGRSIRWLVGPSVSWSVGWLAGCLLARLPACLALPCLDLTCLALFCFVLLCLGWLVGWLVGWRVGWTVVPINAAQSICPRESLHDSFSTTTMRSSFGNGGRSRGWRNDPEALKLRVVHQAGQTNPLTVATWMFT